ncbi:MAG: hypothetical protein LBK99_05395 [Opitutaceae bacterium]|nr:hypothetical protein [Opitutaceae bacterium]
MRGAGLAGGWAKNYSAQIRNRNKGDSLHATLITSDDKGAISSPLAVISDRQSGEKSSRQWPAGQVWQATIRVRQALTLDAFEKIP